MTQCVTKCGDSGRISFVLEVFVNWVYITSSHRARSKRVFQQNYTIVSTGADTLKHFFIAVISWPLWYRVWMTESRFKNINTHTYSYTYISVATGENIKLQTKDTSACSRRSNKIHWPVFGAYNAYTRRNRNGSGNNRKLIYTNKSYFSSRPVSRFNSAERYEIISL